MPTKDFAPPARAGSEHLGTRSVRSGGEPVPGGREKRMDSARLPP